MTTTEPSTSADTDIIAPELEADYLVVGAGAMGMAFVDELIEDPNVEVIMVDRGPAPGGHWLNSYPFVRLHQPSANYGVNSTPLGHDRIERDGSNRGYYELAGGTEVCGYFDGVMRHRLLASGRVRFLPMCDYIANGRFRSRLTDRVSEVRVRRRVVDATYVASRVPATDPPPFEIDEGVTWFPVGGLAGLERSPAGYVIVGGGKTSLDACSWLLDQGVQPEDITWIRPRDTWLLNRAFFQPGDRAVSTLEGAAIQVEATAASDSVADAFGRMEQATVMLRTDPSVEPTMMKGATVTVAELEQLRRIENVVRLGQVRRIGHDEIVLDKGSIATSPDHVHVHCASPGLGLNPPRPIFTDDTITLQMVTRVNLTLSAALVGFIERTGRPTEEKNRLAPPNTSPDTPLDWLRVMLMGINAEMQWQDATDVQTWLENSRLNPLKGLDPGTADEAVLNLWGRLLAATLPALANLGEFGSRATPAERQRMFEPVLSESVAVP